MEQVEALFGYYSAAFKLHKQQQQTTRTFPSLFVELVQNLSLLVDGDDNFDAAWCGPDVSSDGPDEVHLWLCFQGLVLNIRIYPEDKNVQSDVSFVGDEDIKYQPTERDRLLFKKIIDNTDLLARGSRLQNALVDFSQISNKSQSNKFYTFKEDGQTVEMICAAIYEPMAWYITIRKLQ